MAKIKGDIAIALIVKDEADYLDEWLDYHFKIGFDRVFLAVNDSKDDCNKYTPIFCKYADKINVFDYTGQEAMQLPFYNYIIEYEDYEWCVFIDADEFISFEPSMGITNIRDFLEKMPNEITAYKMNWKLYGDDNQIYYENKPVRERFINVLPDVYASYMFPEQFHTKSMIHKAVKAHFTNNPHTIRETDYWLTDGTKTDSSPFNPQLDKSVIYVAHYYTKTIEEWVRHKLGRNYADYKRYAGVSYYPISTFFKYNEVTEGKIKYLEKHGIKYSK